MLQNDAPPISSPLSFVGGKNLLAERYVEELFPDDYQLYRYVEPFCGSAAVFFYKLPSEFEVLNDLDRHLINWYECMKDEYTYALLHLECYFTPYSRTLFEEAKAELPTAKDRVDAAVMYFRQNKMSFSGNHRGWSTVLEDSRCGVAAPCRRYHAAIEKFPAVHERLKGAIVDCRDAVEVILAYDRPDTLFFIDPPYALSNGAEYRQKFSLDDHRRLVEALRNIKGRAVLCGDDSALYRPLEEAGWSLISFGALSVGARRKAKTKVRQELVWKNF